MNLEVLEQVEAKFVFNKEVITQNVMVELSRYKDLVFTEETVKDGKKCVAELNKLITALDNERKKRKSEMSKPVKVMEDEFNEIIKLIKEGIEPIKLQMDGFEEDRKVKKEEDVTTLVGALLLGAGLDQKRIVKVTFNPKWLNKTYLLSTIEEEVKELIEKLQAEQHQEKQAHAKISEECQTYELDPTPYLKNYEFNGGLIIPILDDIKNYAMAQLKKKQETEVRALEEKARREKAELERRAKMMQVEQSRAEISQGLSENPNHLDEGEEMTFMIKITAPRGRLAILGNFLKSQNYHYEKGNYNEEGMIEWKLPKHLN